MYRFLSFWFFIFSLATAWQTAGAQTDSNAVRPAFDSTMRYRSWQGNIPFADSNRTDSLRQALDMLYRPAFNRTPMPPATEAWSPFKNLVYKKQVNARNWFFYISLLILALVLINKNSFPAVYSVRLRSVFSRSAFHDLMENLKTQTELSSVLAILTAHAVMAQLIVIALMAFGYSLLANNFLFFLSVFIFLLAWWILLFLVQYLHTRILGMGGMHRTAMMAKTNLELLLSLGLLPISLFVYLNLDRLDTNVVGAAMLVLLSALLVARFSIALFQQFKFGHLNFFGLLYFCGLELLPHLLVLTFITQALR
ncbi:MAG: DUF4271 domain-containing protein [Bacteroidota bacterium]|jgi:hypothetical protein